MKRTSREISSPLDSPYQDHALGVRCNTLENLTFLFSVIPATLERSFLNYYQAQLYIEYSELVQPLLLLQDP